MNEIPDNEITIPDISLTSSDIGFIIIAPLNIKSSEAPEEINVRLILRLNKYGTYETRADFTISLKETLFPSVYLLLNDMLDTVYSQRDMWPQTSGVIELLINDVYIGGSSLTFSS